MDFIIWMGNLAWKILLIGAGFWVFGAILKNGPETTKEVLKTLGAVIRVGCLQIRRNMANYLRKEASTQKENEEGERVEARIV